MSTATTHVTPEELLRMPDGKEFELSDGQLVERTMSALTSRVAVRLSRFLDEFVDRGRLGWVFDSENGYRCFPHDSTAVRRPDVSFVAAARLSAEEIGRGWLTIPPDLAVEIVSPNDSVTEFEAKLEDYRSAAVPVVWVVHPENRTAWIHHSDGTSRHLVGNDVVLVGEGPLEGFECRLDSLLPTETQATSSAS
jgi:Uma2 family endonuclease